MTFSSSLANVPRPLVLDTSVLINLHACSYGDRVLTAVANDIVVPDIVAAELGHETSRLNGDDSFLHSLIDRGKVHVASMTDVEYEPSPHPSATVANGYRRRLPRRIIRRR